MCVIVFHKHVSAVLQLTPGSVTMATQAYFWGLHVIPVDPFHIAPLTYGRISRVQHRVTTQQIISCSLPDAVCPPPIMSYSIVEAPCTVLPLYD